MLRLNRCIISLATQGFWGNDSERNPKIYYISIIENERDEIHQSCKTPTQKTKNECTKIKDFCIIYFPSMVCYGVTTKTPAKITVEGDSSDKCCVHMTVLA